MPTIEISPATFSRLQKHAVPLVDTIDNVMNRWADAYEGKGGTPVPAIDGGEVSNVREFNPNTPPDLTHTKVLEIEFDGKPLAHDDVHWSGLLRVAIRAAKARAKSNADLKRLISVNFVDYEKSDEGYQFLRDTGLSFQRLDANGTWRGVCHIAQQIGCKLKVTFIWRDKEDAAFPGQTGQFNIGSRP